MKSVQVPRLSDDELTRETFVFNLTSDLALVLVEYRIERRGTENGYWILASLWRCMSDDDAPAVNSEIVAQAKINVLNLITYE